MFPCWAVDGWVEGSRLLLWASETASTWPAHLHSSGTRGRGCRTMATGLCVREVNSTGLSSFLSPPSQRDLKMYSQRFGTVPREFKGPTPKAVIIVSTGDLCAGKLRTFSIS